MKPQSLKAKGRVLQNEIMFALRALGKDFGLDYDDIKAAIMGCNGVDIKLSPLGRKVLGPLACECKYQEALNVTTTFKHILEKYPASIPLLFSRRNYTKTMVTMSLPHFLLLMRQVMESGARPFAPEPKDADPNVTQG